MPAFVTIRNGPFRDVSRLRVRRWAERMLGAVDFSQAELSVVITDDREMRDLNRTFRRLDRPTDVLAFAMREGEPMGRALTPGGALPYEEMLGDVVVSVETARRQASQHRRPLEAEMRMLLAHGLLHLIGYDHRTAREEAVMNAATLRLCRAAQREPRAPLPRAKSSARSRGAARK